MTQRRRGPQARPIPAEWLRIGSKDGDEWVLYWRQGRDAIGWHNVVLRHNGRDVSKQAYWTAWNGSRMTECSDMTSLHERFPEVHAWLQAFCRNKWRNEARSAA
jgi:hypothetical protein